jgi:hypothetical protein
MKQFTSVNSSRGAPMGRASFCDNEEAKVQLFRVRMVDYDYDDGGAYWGGGGTPLYCARDKAGEVQLFYRADNREEARKAVLDEYPDLRFFR